MLKILLLLVLCFISVPANEEFYAIKGGIFSHNAGIVTSGKDGCIDIHAELLYNKRILKGYPTIGTEININGDSSFVYTGLSWEKKYFKNFLIGAFFGAAAHNGNLNSENSNQRKLGTRFLFREAIDIGYYINSKYVISFLANHYSNAGLGGVKNQGNSNIGFRLSYYF